MNLAWRASVVDPFRQDVASAVREAPRNSGVTLMAVVTLGGAIAASGAAQLLRSYLHGISPFDPGTYAAVAIVLTGLGVLAAYVPARRAVRLDPAAILRAE